MQSGISPLPSSAASRRKSAVREVCHPDALRRNSCCLAQNGNRVFPVADAAGGVLCRRRASRRKLPGSSSASRSVALPPFRSGESGRLFCRTDADLPCHQSGTGDPVFNSGAPFKSMTCSGISECGRWEVAAVFSGGLQIVRFHAILTV